MELGTDADDKESKNATFSTFQNTAEKSDPILATNATDADASQTPAS